jgi:hypothetical protein
MRQLSIMLILVAPVWAQNPVPQGQEQTPSSRASIRTDFRVQYVNGNNAYLDGGRDAGLAEGTELILKQDPTKSGPANEAIEPGVIAKLKVVAIASASAVCEIEVSSRNVTSGDVLSLPDTEVAKRVENDTLGNTRQYPMVVSFSSGDPLDEEVREKVPRPPLPEINQIRGRIGFDISSIREVGQGSSTSSSYGMVFRADFTRIFGTHWNLNGYWRGNLRRNSSAYQNSIQDLINRTYLMSLSYVNPESRWSAGIGRLYVPYASSLETIDGAYTGVQFSKHAMLGTFAGSTPDPTSWSYNPDRRIGGAYINFRGGSFDTFRFSTTAGYGLELLKWNINRPFVFAENDVSFKRIFSVYHSMQIDRPAANPGAEAIRTGLGQSLLSLRVQVHPRVALDVTDTYFRDVPTYDATLVGTGLLDKYLYQGINGGARIQFPRHITGYFSLGSSTDSNDPKDALNKMFGVTVADIWKTGLTADARIAQFDSSFASGKYTTFTVSRDMLDNLRLNLQFGKYAYTSNVATNSDSSFVNFVFDSNLGAKLFFESMYTIQRGGSLNYNQWTSTLGYRFDNRAATRRREAANVP